VTDLKILQKGIKNYSYQTSFKNFNVICSTAHLNAVSTKWDGS